MGRGGEWNMHESTFQTGSNYPHANVEINSNNYRSKFANLIYELLYLALFTSFNMWFLLDRDLMVKLEKEDLVDLRAIREAKAQKEMLDAMEHQESR